MQFLRTDKCNEALLLSAVRQNLAGNSDFNSPTAMFSTDYISSDAQHLKQNGYSR